MNSNSSDKILVYDWHSYRNSNVCWMAMACFICGGAAIYFFRNIASLFLGGIFLVSGVALFFPGRTKINFSKRLLNREILFFGRYRIWTKTLSLENFDAIVIDERGRYRRQQETYQCLVGLRRSTGRRLWICYFSDQPTGSSCAEAGALASMWSRELGFPIKRRT